MVVRACVHSWTFYFSLFFISFFCTQTLEERVMDLQSKLQGTEAILFQLRGEG